MLTSIAITGPPATTPVSLEAAKLHLRLDGDDEDDLVLALIDAAADLAGESAGLAWILTEFEATFDGWSADGILRLPRGPIVAVESIGLRDADGQLVELDPSAYRALPGSDLVVRPIGADWSLDPEACPPAPDRVVCRWTAGYGESPESVPPRVRSAVLLVLGHLYEHRGDDEAPALPGAVEALLAGVRGARYG